MDYRETKIPASDVPAQPPAASAPAVARRRKISWKLIAGLVVAVIAIALIVRLVMPKQQAPTGGRFGLGTPMAAATAAAEKGDIPVTLRALGTVTPLATVTVRSQISGQLQQIAFQEGQTVQKGDFLALIDPRPYEAALDQAKGQLARDQALLTNARLDLSRYRKLAQEDSIAGQQVDTQAALVRQYEGTIATDQAQVDTAALNLSYCHVVSPITGRVGLRQVDVGNFVSTGDANGIVVVTQVDPITALFPVPEDNIPAIMGEVRSGATLQVTASDRANTKILATGHLTTVDNQIDTTTGTVKLRAEFDNKDLVLFPNQFVNVQLLIKTLHDQTVIPATAVQRGAPGTFVYVVNADHTVTMRPVTLGLSDGVRQAVEKGLMPGETVVTEGGDRLRDGATIAVPGETPQTPAAGDGQRRRRGGGARPDGAAGQGGPRGPRGGGGPPPQ